MFILILLYFLKALKRDPQLSGVERLIRVRHNNTQPEPMTRRVHLSYISESAYAQIELFIAVFLSNYLLLDSAVSSKSLVQKNVCCCVALNQIGI